ncbi:MAG TPA: FtsH protease activity modulator HflK [Burkholderiales bacterium]|nr:FtsH protease activity modulator HflK [Burkholderiales bacterium]
MSLNDPQWGRKGPRGGGDNNNQGPPDLDELWRNFNQRLSALFGRKSPDSGGPAGPGGGQGPNMAQFGGGFGLLIALIVIVWLASGFYTVDASQRAVVLTFGAYTETTDPGLRWRLPFPIQRHEIVNLSQVRTIEVGYRNNVKTKVLRESLMLTDDENIVDIQFAVQYLLKDPEDYQFNIRQPDETVMQVAEAAMREIVGKSSMDFVLYEGREQIAVTAQALMQDILDRYQTGITISTVTLQNAQPPEQVQAAFDDAVKAKQDLERQKNEGQAYYNDVVPKARGAASRLTEEAEGYRQRVVANAEGEAARFSQVLKEYAKAPAITRERMYLEVMQQIFTSTTKVMVDARENGNLLFLPLDKLMQMSSSEITGMSGTSKPSAMDSAPATETNRSRDSLLSRDRGPRP